MIEASKLIYLQCTTEIDIQDRVEIFIRKSLLSTKSQPMHTAVLPGKN
jgi:hypothetical protein